MANESRLTTTIKFEASDEEVLSIRDELANWSDDELLKELQLIGDLNSKTSEEEIKEYRIGLLTLALVREQLQKRGYKLWVVPK